MTPRLDKCCGCESAAEKLAAIVGSSVQARALEQITHSNVAC